MHSFLLAVSSRAPYSELNPASQQAVHLAQVTMFRDTTKQYAVVPIFPTWCHRIIASHVSKTAINICLKFMSKYYHMLNNAAFPDLQAHFWTFRLISGKIYSSSTHCSRTKLESIHSTIFVVHGEPPHFSLGQKQSQLAI